MPALNDPRPDSTPTYDDFHAVLVDQVCEADRARAEGGQSSWVRRAVLHEHCRPGQPCDLTASMTAVTVVAPGARVRRPLMLSGARA